MTQGPEGQCMSYLRGRQSLSQAQTGLEERLLGRLGQVLSAAARMIHCAAMIDLALSSARVAHDQLDAIGVSGLSMLKPGTLRRDIRAEHGLASVYLLPGPLFEISVKTKLISSHKSRGYWVRHMSWHVHTPG